MDETDQDWLRTHIPTVLSDTLSAFLRFLANTLVSKSLTHKVWSSSLQNSGEHSAMIDGKGLAGSVGCQCAGCTAAVSTSSRIAETGKKKEWGGMKERTREVEWEAKRGHEERGEKKPSLPFFCPSGRPGVCSFVLSRTTQPGTAASEQVLLIVLFLPNDGHN